MKKIVFDVFAKEIIDNLKQNNVNTPDIDTILFHLKQALGGISNLYLEQALEIEEKDKHGLFESQTVGISCKEVPKLEIVLEISHCTGYEIGESEKILEAIETSIVEIFKKENLQNPGDEISFPPIGKFKVIDLQNRIFFLEYEDPARPRYSSFLLGY